MRSILEATAKEAGDKAAQVVVAEYKPKVDVLIKQLGEAETAKWEWGIGGLLVGGAVVAILELWRK